MTFLCPTCHTGTLQSVHLEPELQTECCSTCGGHWITSARYFAYTTLEANASEMPLAPPVERTSPDSSTLKRCPTCAKFMRYYPVGHGLAFGIDKCGTCGGVWLDGREWEALKAIGFHRRLHAISSDSWQAEVHRQRRAELDRLSLEKRIGMQDLQRVDDLVSWLLAHAHRAEILAYVQQQVRIETHPLGLPPLAKSY